MITRAADCEAAVEIALQEFRRIDILINNVGIKSAAGTPHLLYLMSKGAVVNMTRAMVAHHARRIRVNSVYPGVRIAFISPRSRVFLLEAPEVFLSRP